MPYPSTPLNSPPIFTSLSPLLRQPNHRSLGSPPVSCFSQRARSPLLSPRHHVISISSGLDCADDYFAVAYEGTTRTPGCTPQSTDASAMSLARDLGLSNHDFATSLATRASNLDLNSIDQMLQISPNLAGRRKGPGLRISEMPPVILQSMIRGDSDESNDSDGTLKMSPGEKRVYNYVSEGVGLGLTIDDGEGRGGDKTKRVPTPYPSERESWLEQSDLEDLAHLEA